MSIHRCICSRSFPSTQEVYKFHGKWAACETVLWDAAFVIAGWMLIFCWRTSIDMCPIHSPNHATKIGPEFWWSQWWNLISSWWLWQVWSATDLTGDLWAKSFFPGVGSTLKLHMSVSVNFRTRGLKWKWTHLAAAWGWKAASVMLETAPNQVPKLSCLSLPSRPRSVLSSAQERVSWQVWQNMRAIPLASVLLPIGAPTWMGNCISTWCDNENCNGNVPQRHCLSSRQ